jgi:hypothetical protein
MSTIKKLLGRFLLRPHDFSFSELTRLLKHFGYRVCSKGKTSGSRVAFINQEKHIIRLHKPHPKEILKQYQIDYITELLRKKGYLE